MQAILCTFDAARKPLLNALLCGALLCTAAVSALAAKENVAVDSVNTAWLAANFVEQKDLKQALSDFQSATGVQVVISCQTDGQQLSAIERLAAFFQKIAGMQERGSRCIPIVLTWRERVVAGGYSIDSISVKPSLAEGLLPDSALRVFCANVEGIREDKVPVMYKKDVAAHRKIAAELKKLQNMAKGMTVTLSQLQAVFPNVSPEVVAVINKYSAEFEINTPARMSNFLAQTGYESGGFAAKKGESGCYTAANADGWKIWFSKTWNERPFGASCDASLNPAQKDKKKLKWTALTCSSTDKSCVAVPSEFICGGGAVAGEELNKKFFSYVYQCEGGNGNSASGDGYKYRGHGAIQLTWKKAYQNFDTWLKKNHKDKYKDVLSNPNILDDDKELYILSAMWFWDTRKLNKLADGGEIDAITCAINTKCEGGKKREEYVEQLKNQLK
jgi:predicted chitinase